MRVAVLASGGGTILEAILTDGIPVALVLTDRSAPATQVAARFGVQAVVVERAGYGPDFDRDAFSAQVADVLSQHQIDLVVLAGFGTVFSQPMFDAFGGRIVNTHPALLPAFKGWHAVADALAYGVLVTGCTVHVATPDVDAGPILAQEAVAVQPEDTVESLHERIKIVERRLYVKTIHEILERGSVR